MASIVPLTSQVLSPGQDQPSRSQPVMEFIGLGNTAGSFQVLVGLVVASILIRGVALFGAYSLVGRIAAEVECKFANKSFAALIASRLNYLQTIGTSQAVDSIARLTRELNWCVSAIAPALSGLFLATVFIIVAGIVSPGALIISAVIGLPIVIVMRATAKSTRLVGGSLNETLKRRHRLINEVFHNVKFVKANHAEEQVGNKIQKLNSKIQTNAAKLADRSAVITALPDTIIVIGISAVLWLIMVYASDRSEAIAFSLLLIYRAFHYLNLFQTSYNFISQYRHAYASLKQIIADAELDPEPTRAGLDTDDGFSFNEAIEFSQVTFAYPGESPIIDNLNFSITKGEKVLVVGPSGSGKSTFLDLLLGLQAPSMGEIRIDGRPLVKSAIAAWRRHVCYVPQEPAIFYGTVRDNLLWFGSDITDERIWQVLSIVKLDDMVRNRAGGLDAEVGEGGMVVSGGEKQRLALARAILSDARVLVLDEVTSAVDLDTCHVIWKVLSELSADLTCIFVTHQQVNNLAWSKVLSITRSKPREG
ncbi:MAG: ABC transporter ATP-binding protein [Deltaproteobacteria bacterium]|nr:ABC transporter ATP-binding protein [Deltaproteobacteria bacterium]